MPRSPRIRYLGTPTTPTPETSEYYHVPKILVREPRLMVPRQKPVGAVKLDTNHWLGKRIIRAWPFTSMTRLVDVASGKSLTVTGTPVLGVFNGRYCLDFSGSGQAAYTTLDLSAYSSVSVISSIRFDTIPSSGNFAMLFEHTSDGYLVNGGFSSWLQGGAGFYAVHKQAAGTCFLAATIPNAETWYSFIMTYNFSAPADTEVNIYKEGILQSGSRTSVENSGVYANSTFYIAARTASSLHVDGKYEYLYLVSGELTQGQITDVFANPYQFLIPT